MATVAQASTSSRPIRSKKGRVAKAGSSTSDKKTRKPPLGKLLASSGTTDNVSNGDGDATADDIERVIQTRKRAKMQSNISWSI